MLHSFYATGYQQICCHTYLWKCVFSGMYLRFCGVVINLLACLLYIVEAIWADVDVSQGSAVLSCGSATSNLSSHPLDQNTSEETMFM